MQVKLTVLIQDKRGITDEHRTEIMAGAAKNVIPCTTQTPAEVIHGIVSVNMREIWRDTDIGDG